MCLKCTNIKTEERPSITDLIVDLHIDYYKIFGKEFFEDILLFLSNSENPHSQFKLGLLFYEGKSVPKNDRKAFILFSLSANQDNPEAQHYLGLMYYEGNEYFLRNTNVAYQYFSIASKNYPLSKQYCDLIQENSKSIEIAFQELPPKLQSILNSIENSTLKKMYSNFHFLFLPLDEIYAKHKNISEQLIEDYLLKILNQFKFII